MSLSLSIAIGAESTEGKFTVTMEQKYYSWKDDNDNKGYQHVMPLTISYKNQNFNAGLRRAYIISENKSKGREGRVAHWSDTSLSFAYTSDYYKSLPMRFNLSMNIPNGKATLSQKERNAVMDGHLVWQTRFGEGFNVTPGINVSHALTKKDSLGLGLSHTFQGDFDPNEEQKNDVIDPGDISTVVLQYQHNDSNWYAQSSLNYQHSGVTQRDKQDSYQKGDSWNVAVNGGYSITPKHIVRMNYNYSHRERDKSFDAKQQALVTEKFNSNGDSHSFGLNYTYKINDKHSVGILGNYLNINGNDYDYVNSRYLPERKKWSIGARYNMKVNKDLSLSLQAKRFALKEAESPHYRMTANGLTTENRDENYHGWNISANLQYGF